MKNKKMIILAAVAAVIAVAGAAAYFLSQGSGTTTVAIGAAPSITVTPNGSGLTALLPGDTVSVPVSLTNGGAKTQHVGSLTGTVTDTAPGCNPSWFTVAPTTLDQDVLGGTTINTHVDVSFTETGTDQSVCENDTPTLTVVAG